VFDICILYYVCTTYSDGKWTAYRESIELGLDDRQLVDALRDYDDKQRIVQTRLQYCEVSEECVCVFIIFTYLTQDGLMFATQLKDILPTIARLFQSKASSDVLEAIDFVITCTQFNVPGADTTVRCVLCVCSKIVLHLFFCLVKCAI
jgi:hypothetical protein